MTKVVKTIKTPAKKKTSSLKPLTLDKKVEKKKTVKKSSPKKNTSSLKKSPKKINKKTEIVKKSLKNEEKKVKKILPKIVKKNKTKKKIKIIDRNSSISELASIKKDKAKKSDFYYGAGVTLFSLILLFVFIASIISSLINIALRYDSLLKEQKIEEYDNLKLEEVSDSYLDSLGLTESEEVYLDKETILERSEFFSINPEGERRITALNFIHSNDGNSFAYVVKEDDNSSAVVLNDKQGDNYQAIKFMNFSPDSNHFAYGVRKGNDELVVLDGIEGRAYDFVMEPFTFTSDSRFLVYKARDNRGDFLVFNQEESGPYDQIYNPFVNKEANELIFFARSGDIIIKHSLKLK